MTQMESTEDETKDQLLNHHWKVVRLISLNKGAKMIKSKEEEFYILKFKCKCGNTLRWGVGANAIVRKICECGKIYVLDKETLQINEE